MGNFARMLVQVTFSIRKQFNFPALTIIPEGVTVEVHVRFFTILREVTDKKEETLHFPEDEKVTINTLLDCLTKQYGKPFQDYVFDFPNGGVKKFLQFFVNGKSTAALNGLDSELCDGDTLAIVPPVGGG